MTSSAGRGRPFAICVGLLVSACLWMPSAASGNDLFYIQREQLRQIKQRIRAELTLEDVPPDSRWLTEHVRWWRCQRVSESIGRRCCR